MMNDVRTIAFIGAGNMSRSIISGLVNSGFPGKYVIASNPSSGKLLALEADFGTRSAADNLTAVKEADVVVLAVKPQLMKEVCSDIATLDLTGKLFISIAAGITCERLTQYLGGYDNIVRTMPNTPSLLGLGLTGLYADNQVSTKDRQFAGQLLLAVGQILWLKDEAGIDHVIACAGSSPAYFFLFMEAMEEGAAELGVDPQEARLMIQQAAIGAAEMVRNNPNLSLAELRAQVTSKGGTTHEAIQTFENQGLRGTVKAAMHAAVQRAKEMAKQF